MAQFVVPPVDLRGGGGQTLFERISDLTAALRKIHDLKVAPSEWNGAVREMKRIADIALKDEVQS